MSDIKIDTGGPAFPLTIVHPHGHDADVRLAGLSVRDYFAAHATEADIGAFIPKTMGGVADLMVSLGWIKPYDRTYLMNAYTEAQSLALRYWARYQHADMMLKARKE